MMEEESVLSQRYRNFFGWDNKRGLFVTLSVADSEDSQVSVSRVRRGG